MTPGFWASCVDKVLFSEVQKFGRTVGNQVVLAILSFKKCLLDIEVELSWQLVMGSEGIGNLGVVCL